MQDRGPGMKWYGTLFISCLWLLILSTVIVSAIGFLEWLDALYIISYVKIVAIAIQYAPQVGLVLQIIFVKHVHAGNIHMHVLPTPQNYYTAAYSGLCYYKGFSYAPFALLSNTQWSVGPAPV